MSDKNCKGGKLEEDGRKNEDGQEILSHRNPATQGKPSPRDTPRTKAGRQKKPGGAARRAARRRRQMMAYGIPSIIILIIVAFVYLGSVRVRGPALNAVFAEGQAVPSFSAPGINGGTVSWHKGRPTVLTIWAAWCSHCQVEVPKLNKIKDDNPEVNIVSIVTGEGQQPGPKPAKFVADNNITIPVAVDDAGRTLAQAMGVRALPTLYFISADGTVFKKMEIELPDADLRAGFEHLKAQAGAAAALPSSEKGASR